MAPTTSATSRCCSAPPPTSASTSARSRSAASTPTSLAAAATGASSRWPTCVPGWRRWRTRATSWRSTLCWPRRSLASRSTGSRCSACGGASLRHHLWRMLDEDEVAAELPEGDREQAERFVELFRAERATAPRVSLETLIDRAVTETGYDRAVLSLPAGERRMANVRKLMRMAREYEGEEGARPARLHRLRRRARPDPGARGAGAARGGGARRRSPDDDSPCQGPRVPGRVRRRPRQGRPRGRRRPAHLGRWRGGPAPGRDRRWGDRQRQAQSDQGAAQARGRGGGEADLLRGRDPGPGAPGPERGDRPGEARGGEAAGGADALGLALVRTRPARSGSGRGCG